MNQDEIYYKLNWHPNSSIPGQHRSAAQGDGFEFDTHVPLGEGVDPRRFDLLASSRDPLERLLVRRYRQTSAVDITVIADLSSSMLVTRSIRKADILARLTSALARSVYRNGDYFAFYGCTDTPLSGYICPRTRDGYSGLEVAAKLLQNAEIENQTEGAVFGVNAIDQVASQLSSRRGMVFLVSDFYMNCSALDVILERLGNHMVIPLFIEDSAETRMPPAFGLTEMVDVESGNRVSYFMRPGLRRRYVDAFTSHRHSISDVCDRRGCPLLKVADRFVADDVSRYFLEY